MHVFCTIASLKTKRKKGKEKEKKNIEMSNKYRAVEPVPGTGAASLEVLATTATSAPESNPSFYANLSLDNISKYLFSVVVFCCRSLLLFFVFLCCSFYCSFCCSGFFFSFFFNITLENMSCFFWFFSLSLILLLLLLARFYHCQNDCRCCHSFC